MWILLLGLAFAKDPGVEIDAQLRPRVEADSVRGTPPGEGPVLYTTLRSRVGVTATQGPLQLRVLGSDVRTLGEETDTRRDYSADGLDLREAWLRWGGGRMSFYVGRFERGLYNERLLAIANWRQSGRSFDGVIFEAAPTPSIRLEARGYVLREGTPQVAATDQALPGGRDSGLALLTLQWTGSQHTLAPLLIVDGDGEVERLRATTGAYAHLLTDAWRFEAEGYLQAGREGEEALLAGMVGARADWRSGWGGLGAAYALLSADADPSDGRRTSFNTLYGANHRYYGHVDIATFYVGGQVDEQGLHDAQLSARWAVTERVGLTLDLHTFVAALAVEDRLLAVEPDLYLRAQLAPGLQLSGGGNFWIAPTPDEREWMAWLMLDGRVQAPLARRGAPSAPQ